MNLTYLKEVLEAREARVEKQCGLLCDGGVLVSFSLNIPGPVKNAVLYRYVFETGLAEIRKALSELPDQAVKEETGESAAGNYAFFLIPEGETVTELTAKARRSGEKSAEKSAEKPAAEKTADRETGRFALEVKRRMVRVEEASPLGRLYDIDVLYRKTAAAGEAGPAGNGASAKDAETPGNAETSPETGCPVKVSRRELGFPARACLVCGSPAFTCVRAARHKVPEVLMAVIDRILSSEEIRKKLLLKENKCGIEADPGTDKEPDRDTAAYAYAETVALEALRAILYEVTVTPKPGLVDTENNGAHRDMNITTFFDSAAALAPYFKECVLEGIRRAGEPEEKMLPYLRPPGIRAEEEMYRATSGINTHKGAIFTMGLFCAAAGVLYAREEKETGTGTGEKTAPSDETGQSEGFPAREIPLLAGRIASAMENGSRGVRAEAMNGYPSLTQAMEKVYREEKKEGESTPSQDSRLQGPGGREEKAADQNRRRNAAGVRLLLELMRQLDDSNAARRGGEEAAKKLRKRAEEVLTASEDAAALFRNAEEFDRELIRENISPGGAADLLAAGFFLQFLENLHKKREI